MVDPPVVRQVNPARTRCGRLGPARTDRVTRRGRAVAAIVPIEDLDLLERMEDELDLRAAREALADPGNATPIPWDEVEAELGR